MNLGKSLHSATAEKVLNPLKHRCSIYRTSIRLDKYYNSVDDFFEDYALNYNDEEVYNKPQRLWVTSVGEIAIDATDVVGNACEELYEDAYEQCDIESLQKFLDEWCEKQTGATTYYPCYDQYVTIDWNKY